MTRFNVARVSAFAVLAASTLMTASAEAGGCSGGGGYFPPYQPRPIVRIPVQPPVVHRPIIQQPIVPVPEVRPVVPHGHFSPNLRAHFSIERVHAGGHCFTAAVLTCDPQPGSPLVQAGLRKGDIITRLNDVRVLTYSELDRHFDHTTVRYFCKFDNRFENGQVFIPNNSFDVAQNGVGGP